MKSNLMLYYRALNSEKKFRCLDFFASPYFNKSTVQINLFELFSKEKFEIMTREKVFEFIHGNKKPFNDAVLKKNLSDHKKMLKRFFIVEFGDSSETIWVTVLHKLGVNGSQFEKNLRHAKKKEAINPIIANEADYHKQYILHEIAIHHHSEKQKLPIDILKETYVAQNESLDNYFYLSKLKIIAAYHSLKSVLNLEYSVQWEKEITSLYKSNYLAENIEVKLFRLIIEIRKDNTRLDLFQKFLNIIKAEEFTTLSMKTRRNIYKNAVGLCIILIVRKNAIQFNPVLHELYSQALNLGVLQNSEGKIKQRTFKNIVRCAINNEEYEWANTFIKSAKKWLIESEITDSRNFNFGVLFFANREFKKSLTYFSQVPYDNLYYSADLRTYMVRAYYETNELDALYSLIDSFRAFLKRNRTYSIVFIEAFRNFLNAVNYLTKVNPRDKKKILLFKQKIENRNPIAEKKWLLEKVNILEK